MALHSRFDDPSVVLFVTGVLLGVPALTVSVGGGVGSVVAGVVVSLAAGLLSWRLRLLTPVVVAVAAVALTVWAIDGSRILAVVTVVPVVAAAGAIEYAVRRLVDRQRVRLSPESETAIGVGSIAGLAWAGVVHLVLPASDDFGVVVDDVGPDGFVEPVASLVFAVSGPVLVVGLAVALLLRFRLVTPLLFAAIEIGSFLTGPTSGDSVGSAASLLWTLGVPLLLAVAAVELRLRTTWLPSVRPNVDAR